MTKVQSLKSLLKKLTGVDSKGATISEVLDDFTKNYNSSSTMYQSVYVTTQETNTIPINIQGYNKDKDMLFVYINRLKVIKNVDYTISSNEQIVLTESLLQGQTVEFIVIQGGA